MATTFNKLTDLVSRREDRMSDRPKVTYFSKLLSESKKGRVKLRFLQELSEEAELYDASKGTFFGATEHQAVGPKGYLSRALDTSDPDEDGGGRDWADEMHELYKRMGFGPKENFYINVAVETFDDEGEKEIKAAILSRPIASDFVTQLITRYNESDGRGITDKTFWLQRTGQGPQTKWVLELENDPAKQIDVSGVELFDLPQVAVMRVPYDKQAAFYRKNSDVDWVLRDLAKRDVKRASDKAAEGKGEPLSYEEALAAVQEAAAPFLEAWERSGGSVAAASDSSNDDDEPAQQRSTSGKKFGNWK